MATSSNSTTMSFDLPPLPAYTLTPQPDLLPFISDFWLSQFLPHITYWAVSLIFHIIDTFDLLPQYRLHTPAEITQRNHATRYEVARDVFLEQVIQVVTTTLMSLSEPQPMVGMEAHDVAVWATRVRLAQRVLPALLGLVGLNAAALAKSMAASHPLIAGALAGGHYPFLTTTALDDMAGAVRVPTFAAWELLIARVIYWVAVPAVKFWVAIVFQDAWQYWLHRAMHVNRWMYTTWHARHHRLYVPYAYGALYNHPAEAFLMDTVGAALAYKASFLSPRQGMCFFVFCMAKTVDDHCGYALPWDPLQHLTRNNAAYHDIHHQSWGIKTNFSQPFFTFWDRVSGTRYEGDTRLKYARARAAAEAREAANGAANGKGGDGAVNGGAHADANGRTTKPPEELD